MVLVGVAKPFVCDGNSGSVAELDTRAGVPKRMKPSSCPFRESTQPPGCPRFYGGILARMVTGKLEMLYNLDSDFPTLANAPITEALIDIEVELPPEIDLKRLRDFHSGLEERFPKIDERVMVSGTIGLGDPAFTF